MKRALLLSLVLSTLLAMVSAFAVDQARAATNLSIVLPGAPAYTVTENPRWVAVPGTRVYRIDSNAGPDFDVFRQGSYYYAYRGNTWYRARTWNGRYVAVNERYVPAAFNTVSREHWRSYPPGWEKRAMKRHAKQAKQSKHRYH